MIKKTFLILACIAVIVPCSTAIEQITPNRSLIEWDAVVSTVGGGLILDPNSIFYRVYVSPFPFQEGEQTLIGETAKTSFLIQFEREGLWVVGVQSVRTVRNGDEKETQKVESDISWSHDLNVVGSGDGWYYGYWKPPAAPIGLRSKQQ